MSRSRTGILPPLVAALVTLILTWMVGSAPMGQEDSGVRVGMFMLALVPIPFVVSAVWGSALMAGFPRRMVPALAGGWLLVSLALLPAELTWQMCGNVVAGMAAGLALAGRWRLDGALAVVIVPLVPILVWSSLQLPVADQMQEILDQAVESRQETLVGTADDRQIELSLAEEGRRLQQASDIVIRFFPGLLGIGLLGQGGIILALIYWITRKLRVAPAFRSLPPFSRWYLPFYLVWILVAGIGLVLTRQPVLVTVGLNTIMVSLMVISIQGVAVQGFVTNSLMSGPVQIVFWLVMGFLFTPLLIISGVLLGLADYWLDIRRLNVPVQPGQDEDAGNHDDGPDV